MHLQQGTGLLVAQGSASPAQPGPGRHQAALPGSTPPGSSQLPKNRLEKPDLEKTLAAQRPPGPAAPGRCWLLRDGAPHLAGAWVMGVTRAGRGSLCPLGTITGETALPPASSSSSASQGTIPCAPLRRGPGKQRGSPARHRGRTGAGIRRAATGRPQGRRKRRWGRREEPRGPGRG